MFLSLFTLVSPATVCDILPFITLELQNLPQTTKTSLKLFNNGPEMFSFAVRNNPSLSIPWVSKFFWLFKAIPLVASGTDYRATDASEKFGTKKGQITGTEARLTKPKYLQMRQFSLGYR